MVTHSKVPAKNFTSDKYPIVMSSKSIGKQQQSFTGYSMNKKILFLLRRNLLHIRGSFN